MTANKEFPLVVGNLGTFWALWNDELGQPFHNPGREDSESWGAPQYQIPLDMAHGFDLSKGAMVSLHVDDAAKLLGVKNIQKEIRRQREARIKLLLQTPDAVTEYSVSDPEDPSQDSKIAVSNAEVAEVLKATLDTPVTDVVVCGQRRTFAAPWTVVLASKVNPPKGFAKLEPEEQATAAIAAYPFYFDRRKVESSLLLDEMILRENSQNSKLDYSEVGKLRNAIYLLSKRPGLGETDMGYLLSLGDVYDSDGKLLKNNRGARQKAWRWARLAVRHPELDLSTRIGQDPDVYTTGQRKGQLKYVKGTGHVPVKKLDKEDAQSLLGLRKDPTDTVKAVTDTSEQVAATTPQVEAYFKAVITGEKPKGALSKGTLKQIIENPIVAKAEAPVGVVVNAILTGDAEFFAKLTSGAYTPEGEDAPEGEDTPKGEDAPKGKDTPTKDTPKGRGSK